MKPFVKPDIQFINEILDRVQSGEIRVPRFQRPYIWRPKDMISLFDSIKRGYPLGSILLWDTKSDVDTLDNIGPLTIPSKNKPNTFILDGQQRITTLLAGLRYDESSNSDWKWRIYYDLENEEFSHAKKGPEKYYIPVWKLLKTVDFLDEARRIQKLFPIDAEKYIRRAEEIAETFRNYRLSIILIIGGDLNQAVEIFSRLNTRGQAMSIDQMVSALTYREGDDAINLATEISNISESLSQYRFGGISRITILRAIVAAAGRDIHKSEWEEIAKKVTKDLRHAVDSASSSLIQAASFLYNELGVKGDRFLPYANQILFLSYFFNHQKSPSKNQTEILKKWFWTTSLSGWFAGANSTQINTGLSEMKRLAKGDNGDLHPIFLSDESRPLPKNFDMRNARIRAHLLLLANKGIPEVESLQPVDLDKLLEVDSEYTLPHIFLKTKDKGLISDPANRIFSSNLRGKKLQEHVKLLARNNSDVLERIFINDVCVDALNNDDSDKFISERRRLLERAEGQLISEIGLSIDMEDNDEVLDSDL